MIIKKIEASNFKSFNNLEVELSNFNVIIGPNASGKSNFIQVFKFLRDITREGLDNAVSMQGGTEFIRNFNIGSSEPLFMSFVLEGSLLVPWLMRKKRINIGFEASQAVYEFSIKLNKKGPNYKVMDDKIVFKGDLITLKRQGRRYVKSGELGNGEIAIINENGRISVTHQLPEDYTITKDDILPLYYRREKLNPKSLMIGSPAMYFPPVEETMLGISVYDFDPKIPKKAVPLTGKAMLEEDGSNLAIVIKNIMERKEDRTKLVNLVKDVLPFVDEISTEKFADKSMLIKIKETYSPDSYVPASLISDGTINITALVVALYFGNRALTIIEEPERNIHPSLLSEVVDMMQDASSNKQIIVTTHNPELIKNADMDDILFVSRDADGYSKMEKPIEKDEVKAFLVNEIGIDELYVQNLLGG